MKKLSKKQLQRIKAGKFSLSGALFGGIAQTIKATFGGINDTISTVCGWTMGFREAAKGHAKMSVKIGPADISYDDTVKIKAAENLAEAQMKKGVVNTANPKHIVLANQPEVIELNNHYDNDHHYLDEPSQMMEHSMHMIDEFMHF